MTTEDILRALPIDRTAPKPLKAQLEDLLEKLIARLSPGDLLPPERLISERLQISRVTVRNALNKFYVNGSIVRHGRLGTMIAPRKQEIIRQINPLILGMEHELMHQYPLRFLVYENLPKQKLFWEKVVADYNNKDKNRQVEIVWLDDNQNCEDIRELIKTESIDILMFSSSFNLDIYSDLLPLPNSLKQKIQMDQYIFDDIGCDLQYELPFYLSCPLLLWNQELADKLKIKGIEQRIENGEILSLVQEAAEKLPDSSSSGIRIWDYIHFNLMPEGIKHPEIIQNLFEDLIKQGDIAGKNREKLFVYSQKYPLDNLESFLQEKRLFAVANVSHLQVFDLPKFKYGCKIYPKLGKLHSDILRLSISKNCLDTENASDFFAFLLSPHVQELCSELKDNIPVYIPAVPKHLKNKHNYAPEKAKVILKNLYLNSYYSEEESLFSKLLIFYLREEFKNLLYGKLSPEELMQIIEIKKALLSNKAKIIRKYAI